MRRPADARRDCSSYATAPTINAFHSPRPTQRVALARADGNEHGAAALGYRRMDGDNRALCVHARRCTLAGPATCAAGLARTDRNAAATALKSDELLALVRPAPPDAARAEQALYQHING